MPVSRLGITMREVIAPQYPEMRDALAQDWGRWLDAALPEVAWMPLPNVGATIVQHAERWALDGLILSGGEDPGASPRRDATEAALLDWAIANKVPVLAVCRGAQLAWLRFGGCLEETSGHVACRHDVAWQSGAASYGQQGCSSVASYHRLALAGYGSSVLPLALADGQIEAFRHENAAVLGIVWHPERQESPAAHDLQLIRTFFGFGD